MNSRDIKFICIILSLCAMSAQADVVAFKDAAKIKSWDAWDDHKKPEPPKEKPCVTWKKLNSLDPGLKEVGRLAVRDAKDIKSSKWSVGCETMDRDYANWDSYKAWLRYCTACVERYKDVVDEWRLHGQTWLPQ